MSETLKSFDERVRDKATSLGYDVQLSEDLEAYHQDRNARIIYHVEGRAVSCPTPVYAVGPPAVGSTLAAGGRRWKVGSVHYEGRNCFVGIEKVN